MDGLIMYFQCACGPRETLFANYIRVLVENKLVCMTISSPFLRPYDLGKVSLCSLKKIIPRQDKQIEVAEDPESAHVSFALDVPSPKPCK